MSEFLINPWGRLFFNTLVIASSSVICCLLLFARLPGMELLGVGPHWLLIWVIAWSVHRPWWQGAIAGLILGLIQDGLTQAPPSHTLSLMVVGILTASLQHQRYLQESFISLALIAFIMTFINEGVMAIQYSLWTWRSIEGLWQEQQGVILAGTILTSLWAPVLGYPLVIWWRYLRHLEKEL